MTGVSFAGLFISLAAMSLGWRRITLTRLILSLLLLATHIAASVYYYTYTLTSISDASGYYLDPGHFGSMPFRLGTALVFKICHILRGSFGATYLDCFMMFQSVGFAGISLLIRIFSEIEDRVGIVERRGYLALLFVPSVNFWTSAIGKDAPLFFAICLAIWSLLNLRPRWIWFCTSLGVMVLFRAHIALMAATALAAAVFFDSTISLGRKIALLTAALIGLAFTVGAVKSSLGVDVTSISSLTSYLAEQNSALSAVAGGTSVVGASYPLRVISLLFRPFFFDASGILGVIASFENFGFICALIYTFKHWREFVHLAKTVMFFRFVLIFAFLILFSLTLIYYNVGLGLRERVMAYPMIFSLLVALWSAGRRSSEPAGSTPATTLIAQRQQHRTAIGL